MGALENDLLIDAALRGSADDLVSLLGAGADARAEGRSGWEAGMTALMTAAAHGHVRCVALLLPISDAKARSVAGLTALMLAAGNGRGACVELLLPVSDARARDSSGMSAAEWGLRRGCPEVAALVEGFLRSQAEHSELENAMPKWENAKGAVRRI